MIKHLLRKLSAVLCALVLAGTSLNVNAASQITSTATGWEYRMVQHSTGQVYDNGITFGGEGLIMVTLSDGSQVPGYCIDPNAYLAMAGYSEVPAVNYDALDAATKERLNLVTYFGYGYGSHSGNEWYLATQSLVSDAILGGATVTWTNIHTGEQSQFQDKLNEIEKLIADYKRKPVFDMYHEDGTKAVSSDAFYAGEVVKLVDRENRLAKYKITSLTGAVLCDASGNDRSIPAGEFGENTMYVRFDNPGECNIDLTYGENPIHSNAQFIMVKAGSQNIVTCGSLANLQSTSVNLSARTISIFVEKMAAENENEHITGAVLQLKDITDPSLSDPSWNWTTDGSRHECLNLRPDHSYLLEELTAPAGKYVMKSIEINNPAHGEVYGYQEGVKDADINYSVLKIDAETKEPLAGVTLQLLDEEGSVLHEWVTDGTSHAIGAYVSAGKTYSIHETKTLPGYYFMGEDTVFTTSLYETEPVTITIENLKIHKCVDKINENGKPVKGAKLELRDENNAILDSWTSGEPHDISRFLYPGCSYTIVEKDASLHYYLAVDHVFQVTLTKPENETAENPDVINIVNHHIKYKFAKTDEDGNVVEGAHLAIYDITETEELSEDNLVFDWASTSEAVSYNNLERGHTYKLVEYGSVQGHYVTSDKIWTVPTWRTDEIDPGFSDGEWGDDGLYITITAIDANIRLLIEKVNEDGKPVSGASLSLIDQDEDVVVATYISGNEPIEVDPMLLSAGHTYVLRETSAPAGYYLADDITVTIPWQMNEDHEPLRLVMKDTTIDATALKTDTAGNPIAGVKLAVLEKDSERTVYTWESTLEAEPIGMYLEEGKEYVLRELSSITGYHMAEDIPFTVDSANEEPVRLVMQDEPVEVTFHKFDEEGNVVKEALMQLQDESGAVLYEWMSKEEAEDISGYVEAGKTYVIHEEEAPQGYYGCEDLSFTVPLYPEGPLELSLMDAKIEKSVEKKDEKGNPLEGAELALCDSDGNYIETWISDGSPHAIGHLLHAGQTYSIHEIASPHGYYFAEDISFTIPTHKDEEETVITMEDAKISYRIEKCDENGNPVSGVKLTLKDLHTKEDIPLENNGITTDSPIRLDGVLVAGHTYVLHEEQAVPGVHTAADITFTTQLYGQSGTVKIRMIDETAAISIRKCDENGKALSGAKLIIYETETDEKGNTVISRDEQGNPIIVLTFVSTQSSIDVSEYLMGGKTYVLHEESAPEGYVVSEDITFTADGTASSPQSIVMTDRTVPDQPDTGNFISAKPYLIVFAAGVMMLAIIRRMK